MDFEKINSTNILDGAVQEIGIECSFAGIGNYKFSNILQEIEAYEDTLSEIFLERERYLLNADELLEEMLGK